MNRLPGLFPRKTHPEIPDRNDDGVGRGRDHRLEQAKAPKTNIQIPEKFQNPNPDTTARKISWRLIPGSFLEFGFSFGRDPGMNPPELSIRISPPHLIKPLQLADEQIQREAD